MTGGWRLPWRLNPANLGFLLFFTVTKTVSLLVSRLPFRWSRISWLLFPVLFVQARMFKRGLQRSRYWILSASASLSRREERPDKHSK